MRVRPIILTLVACRVSLTLCFAEDLNIGISKLNGARSKRSTPLDPPLASCPLRSLAAKLRGCSPNANCQLLKAATIARAAFDHQCGRFWFNPRREPCHS